MDLSEKLFEIAHQYASTGFVALISILVVTVYLLQRSVEIQFGLINPFSPNSQSRRLDLGFAYTTLTLILPIILGALCFSFSHLIQKLLQIWSKLIELQVTNGNAENLELLFPFWLSVETKGVNNLIYTLLLILSWVPLLAILTHSIATCCKLNEKNQYLLMAVIVIVSSISLIFSYSFQTSFMQIMIH